jgi:hypothetical protein
MYRMYRQLGSIRSDQGRLDNSQSVRSVHSNAVEVENGHERW